jgi:hypothetical protein
MGIFSLGFVAWAGSLCVLLAALFILPAILSFMKGPIPTLTRRLSENLIFGNLSILNSTTHKANTISYLNASTGGSHARTCSIKVSPRCRMTSYQEGPIHCLVKKRN